MARTERLIDATPAEVFGVLADPRSYAYWVVGSAEVRDADPNWPRKGSRFHHSVGAGPLRIRDYTVVERVEPDRLLQLEAKARPIGSARVVLELEPAEGGTRVTMTEDPANWMSAFVFTPLTHLATRARNVWSLDRLAELAEGRVAIPGGAESAAASLAGDDTVENPRAAERRTAALGAAAGFAAAVASGARHASSWGRSAASRAARRLDR